MIRMLLSENTCGLPLGIVELEKGYRWTIAPEKCKDREEDRADNEADFASNFPVRKIQNPNMHVAKLVRQLSPPPRQFMIKIVCEIILIIVV